MKNRILIKLLSCLLLMSPIVLSSCQTNNNSSGSAVVRNDIKLDTYEIYLAVGDIFDMNSLHIRDNNGNSLSELTFVSHDTNVATVDDNILMAKNIGNTLVEIKNNLAKTYLKVVVEETGNSSLLVISNIKKEINIYAGNTYQLNPKVALSGQKVEAALTYQSTSNNIVSVSETGLINGVSFGTAQIILNATYESYATKEIININIYEEKPTLILDADSNEIYIKDGRYVPALKIVQKGTTKAIINFADIDCTIDKNDIATFDEGGIIPLKTGYFNFYCTAIYDGQTYSLSYAFRVRDIYTINYSKDGKIFYIKDGEYLPNYYESSDKDLELAYWIYEGKEYNQPVYKDMVVDAAFRSKYNSLEGASFYCLDEEAIFISNPSFEMGENGEIIYNSSRYYEDGSKIHTHRFVYYHLSLPLIDFNKYGQDILISCWFIDGIIIGPNGSAIYPNPVLKELNLNIYFTNIASDSATVTFAYSDGKVNTATINDSDVLNGRKGYSPTLVIYYCWSRPIIFYPFIINPANH